MRRYLSNIAELREMVTYDFENFLDGITTTNIQENGIGLSVRVHIHLPNVQLIKTETLGLDQRTVDRGPNTVRCSGLGHLATHRCALSLVLC
uniref:HATPase_c domain-containing protein n=1 Tax=Caenorhabditis tropicalis TaxID=1561998 RepID=A0A1I7THY8_9PELO